MKTAKSNVSSGIPLDDPRSLRGEFLAYVLFLFCCIIDDGMDFFISETPGGFYFLFINIKIEY